jgi:predicted AAA+ superfamily ATPase
MKKADELLLYRDVGQDVAVRCAAMLFGDMEVVEDAGLPSAEAWYTVQREMLKLFGRETVSGAYWQNHLAALVASSDNPFSHAAESGAYDDLLNDAFVNESKHEKAAEFARVETGRIRKALSELPDAEAGLFRLAADELRTIKEMYGYDFFAIDSISGASDNSPSHEKGGRVDNLAGLFASPRDGARRQDVHEALRSDDEWLAAALLARHARTYGAGELEVYDSFFWNDGFVGARTKDPIRFRDIIGETRQKAALVENIEFLLHGLPSHNILLYGDSGTGKSSSIKALANEYADRGLKLVAVPKARIAELPNVIDACAGRGLKFILFIDDLSFEENESAYKSFKSVIEGGVSARPTNVVVCVTSNRRNIVKEVWRDRERQDDVHIRDNLQEKRSLADRFGLTIVYSAPDKAEYVNIVTALAAKAGLDMNEEELKAEALTWEVRHGGRSGRTAKQFVDYRMGRMALGASALKESIIGEFNE